jgi:hypothetical protein
MRHEVPSGVLLALVALGLAVTPMTAAAQSARKPAAKPAPKKESPKDLTGSDVVVLRDGKTLLGQIYDPSPKGTYIVLVRRAWAEANLPAWLEKWKSGEKGANEAAERQRRERLTIWRRDRLVGPGSVAADDRITQWLDRELAKPAGQAEPSVLTTVRLGRADVKTVDRRGMAAARALRYGWVLGFKDPETTPLSDLKDSISARGMSTAGNEPSPLDSLLPPAAETDERWALRRAATEALNDEGLRFVRHGNVVLPEPVPGQPIDPAQAAAVLQETIRDVLGGSTTDPLPARLQGVAAKGRVGAVVTRMELSPDLEGVTVESALYVRTGNGWARGPWRAGTLRVGDVAPGAAEAVADDPQVKAAFGLVDSIAPGMITPQMKQKGLDVGATTKRALSMARSALSRDLAALAVTLEAADAKKSKPNP